MVVGALSALSPAVAGCGSPDTVTARCVDDDRRSDGSYRVVDEDRCDDDSGTGRTGGSFSYYGGSASGGSVSGGTRARPSDAEVVTESGKVIQRGGMGGRGDMDAYVAKPLLGREGASMSITVPAGELERRPGEYGAEGDVFQEFAPLPAFEGQHPVLGRGWSAPGRRAWGSGRPGTSSPTTPHRSSRT